MVIATFSVYSNDKRSSSGIGSRQIPVDNAKKRPAIKLAWNLSQLIVIKTKNNFIFERPQAH